MIWKYVQKYDYSTPEKHIQFIVNKALKIRHNIPGSVLDVGGGLKDRGDIVSPLGKRRVLDIDAGPNIDILGDAHKIPSSTSSFDVVLLFMVLEHLHSPEIAIKECARVLKSGGLLLLTTVQYWHNHGCPYDYYRYTKQGLLHLCSRGGLEVVNIWSLGGPFLVCFHAVELNLPPILRKLFLLSAPIFNYLDYLIFKHEDARELSDSVGWALIAKKK